MRPLVLDVQGFGVFRDQTRWDLRGADFFALLGPTGSGKSTLLDGVIFALYGTAPRWGKDNVIRNALAPSTLEAKVRLFFAIEKRVYVVTRKVRRNPSTNAVSTSDAGLEELLDGEAGIDDEDRLLRSVASGVRPVDAAVPGVVGLTYEEFRRTVVLPQGQFAELLHLGGKQRNDMMVSLLGFELYARIREGAVERRKTADARLTFLTAELDRLSTVTEADLVAAEAAAVALEGLAPVVRDALAASVLAGEQVRAAETAAVTLDGQVTRLQAVRVPGGVDGLDVAVRAAAAAEASADAERHEALVAEAAADAAVAGLPDLLTLQDELARAQRQAQLRASVPVAEAAAAAAATAHAAAAGVLAAAHRRLTSADAASCQARDDRRAAELALAADQQEARSAVDALPPQTVTARWAADRVALVAAVPAAAAAAAAVGPLAEAVAGAEAAVAAAERDVTAADAADDAAGVVAHAASLRQGLVVGEPCPVCEQLVAAVPPPSPGYAPAAASARQVLAAARADLHGAEQRSSAAVRAALDAAAVQDRLTAALAGAPADIAVVDAARERALLGWQALVATRVDGAAAVAADAAEVRARAEAASAQVDADTADRDHRAAAADVTGIRKQLSTTEDVGPAPVAGLEHRIEVVRAARSARTAAAERSAAAARARAAAVESLRQARDQTRQAEETLAAVVADLGRLGSGSIQLGGGDLASRWAAVAAWAGAEAVALAAAAATARDEVAGLRAAETSRCRALLDAVAAVVPALEASTFLPVADVAERWRLASQAAAARADEVRRQLGRTAEVRADAADVRARRDLAKVLAQSLEANYFTAWLVREALTVLVEGASVILMRLSGQQYELRLDETDDITVVDHFDQDLTRAVRTLSGGETFQASLALALALSEQLAGLSSTGTVLETIVLDEGFGTLDPSTLETVATTLEQLAQGDGAGTGRVVGVVTHVQALADRVPVRFRVTKGPRGAAVVREDA